MKHVEQKHAYLFKRFKKDAKFKDEMKQNNSRIFVIFYFPF
jgi:uncharacterized C2H2 Zn-finger protein